MNGSKHVQWLCIHLKNNNNNNNTTTILLFITLIYFVHFLESKSFMIERTSSQQAKITIVKLNKMCLWRSVIKPTWYWLNPEWQNHDVSHPDFYSLRTTDENVEGVVEPVLKTQSTNCVREARVILNKILHKRKIIIHFDLRCSVLLSDVESFSLETITKLPTGYYFGFVFLAWILHLWIAYQKNDFVRINVSWEINYNPVGTNRINNYYRKRKII